MEDQKLREPSKVQETEEDLDFSRFFKYLESERGHEVAIKVVSIFDGVKTLALNKSSTNHTIDLLGKYLVVVFVILAAAYLAFNDKFDSTMGVLFGTLFGYFFGKEKS